MERKMFRAWASYIKYKARKGTICRYTAHLLLHILNRKNRWTNIKNNNIDTVKHEKKKEVFQERQGILGRRKGGLGKRKGEFGRKKEG